MGFLRKTDNGQKESFRRRYFFTSRVLDEFMVFSDGKVFKEVELDFEGIDEIGQGFAHEIFVVFQNQHPEVSLLPLNMSPDVEKMIQHVKKTSL